MSTPRRKNSLLHVILRLCYISLLVCLFLTERSSLYLKKIPNNKKKSNKQHPPLPRIGIFLFPGQTQFWFVLRMAIYGFPYFYKNIHSRNLRMKVLKLRLLFLVQLSLTKFIAALFTILSGFKFQKKIDIQIGLYLFIFTVFAFLCYI